jgi:hypothetical protein
MTKKQKKHLVQENICDISPYDLEYSLKDLKKKVDEWIAKHGEDAYLNWDRYRHYDYDPEPSPTFYLRREREETNEELAQRLGKEKMIMEQHLARDRAEFERLQKKFGPK